MHELNGHDGFRLPDYFLGYITTLTSIALSAGLVILSQHRMRDGRVNAGRRLYCLSNRGHAIVMASKVSSSVVWEKTLAAAGGTLGFLIALTFWSSSGRNGFQDAVFLTFLMLGPLFGVVGGLLPKIGNRVRGQIILVGVLIAAVGWTYGFLSGSEYSIAVSSQDTALVIFSWTALILIGGLLMLRSTGQSSRNGPCKQNEAQSF